ncbi:hypothetical protein V5O48_006794 [Marasmius crinis-equi]|uniref:Heme haloperoxidase family profile domain-containing protein n=1 Tax=Marasmius crinis-equi TaxID=585013 RepID=A0ABR3FIQ6_9AGAR
MRVRNLLAGVAILSGHAFTSSAFSNSTRRSVGFDPHAQLIDVHGEHRFIPPGHGDLRGPCPGLNALANHNYLPHNGVATIDELVEATYRVYGMGKDIGLFLAVYGSLMTGDLLSFSIGGPPPSLLGGLLGRPSGLSGSHNKYETDGSPTRGDLYQVGDNARVHLPQFKALYDKQAGIPISQVNYDIPVLTEFRHERFHESIHNNPYFFYGPFSGIGVQPAAYTFIYRYMANKSAEHPEGILNGEVLKSFFSVHGDDPAHFQYKAGWEQIPENWYKRAIGDEYGMVPYTLDLLAAALQFPLFLSVGGNTGSVDSFTGVNLEDLTGGVYNAQTLLEGDNLACFLVQAAVQTATPDVLNGLVKDVEGAINLLKAPLLNLNCPKLEMMNSQLLEKFPGFRK